MSIDLQILVWAALFTAAWTMVVLTGRLLTPGGVPWAFGNRDSGLAVPAWTERADRAHRNMLENLPIFAILVIAAELTDSTNATTALGAQIFLGARLLYALVYTAGVPVVRTIIFLVSVVGMLMILSQLV